jgi:hypothetical protein
MISTLKKICIQVIVIAGLLSSCYPIDDLKVEDLDIAASVYDKAYYKPDGTVNKFQPLQTFTVVDTIVHIVASGSEDLITHQYDEFVLEQVRLNMLKLGFSEETDPEHNPADVVITVSALTSEHEVYTWYPYWGWYWGYPMYPYNPAQVEKSTGATSYYYYPWPPYGTTYNYQSGSVLIEMVDEARVDPGVDEIPVIWAGIVNGVLQSSDSGTKNRLSKGIDQCFNQSPYLMKDISVSIEQASKIN